jgi:hypothetical protein
MACRITELVLDARDPDLLARFWCEVLGYVELERDEASIEIGPPGVGFGGPQPTIVLNRTDDARGGKLTGTSRKSCNGCSRPARGPPTSARPATNHGMCSLTPKATCSAY